MTNETINQDDFTATYSAEDNKLRIYSVYRLDEELYLRVKEAGFKWAPKQELFVAPRWTPNREDLCIQLAGDIDAEDSTIAERAEAKAARLDSYIEKTHENRDAFQNAANSISERFANGQPILMGHHSQRKAERDKEKAERAQKNAIDATEKIQYLKWKANGVEHHANMKSNPRVISGRIKTLLKELRDHQRALNHAERTHALWLEISKVEDNEEFLKKAIFWAGSRLETGGTCAFGTYSKMQDEEIDVRETVDLLVNSWEKRTESRHSYRWINHILNRLSFERSRLGDVQKYQGKITAAVLQVFAREQGAHKPKAKKIEGESWILESSVTLPAHIANEKYLELTEDEWCNLMQSIGHAVPEKKPAAAPILNFKCASIEGKAYRATEVYSQIEITKEQYAAIDSDDRWIRHSACGQFRFKTIPDPDHSGPYYQRGRMAVFITNSKAHNLPDSDAITFDTVAA